MELLWAKYDVPFPLKGGLPEEWDPLQAHGHAIAGTPAQVRDYIADEASYHLSGVLGAAICIAAMAMLIEFLLASLQRAMTPVALRRGGAGQIEDEFVPELAVETA